MKLLNYIVFYANKILKFLGNIVLAAILLTISAGIVSRYIFGKPFTWTEELATFLMVWLGYISGTIVTIAKKHVVADFLISYAPKKIQKMASILSKILAVCVFIFISVSSYHQLLTSSAYRTAALHIPRNLFYLPLFSLSLFIAFVVAVDILNDIFSGYNIQEKVTRQEDELTRQEELMEVKESEKQMDTFLQNI